MIRKKISDRENKCLSKFNVYHFEMLTRSSSRSLWQTFPLIILVPSLLIVSFAVFVQFFPEFVGINNIQKMTFKKEGRLSPLDPNSYARPGKLINY